MLMLKKEIEEKLARIDVLDNMVAELQAEQQEGHQWVAEVTCPYDIGDVLQASRGIGIHGMEVTSIHAPQFPTEGNRWAITCTAFSKAGERTKRTVTLDELMAPTYDLVKAQS